MVCLPVARPRRSGHNAPRHLLPTRPPVQQRRWHRQSAPRQGRRWHRWPRPWPRRWPHRSQCQLGWEPGSPVMGSGLESVPGTSSWGIAHDVFGVGCLEPRIFARQPDSLRARRGAGSGRHFDHVLTGVAVRPPTAAAMAPSSKASEAANPAFGSALAGLASAAARALSAWPRRRVAWPWLLRLLVGLLVVVDDLLGFRAGFASAAHDDVDEARHLSAAFTTSLFWPKSRLTKPFTIRVRRRWDSARHSGRCFAPGRQRSAHGFAGSRAGVPACRSDAATGPVAPGYRRVSMPLSWSFILGRSQRDRGRLFLPPIGGGGKHRGDEAARAADHLAEAAGEQVEAEQAGQPKRDQAVQHGILPTRHSRPGVQPHNRR